jgi:BirA family biotin operon repressor/biotin-[acetyl-CoA-carboxylase] ligase
LSEEAKAEIDREAIDLQALLPVMVEPVALIANSVSRLMDNIEIFEREGFSHVQSQWNAADRYLEQDVVIQSAERKFIGRCLGVDDTGALLLRTVSGVARITGGEIFPSVRRLGES